MTLSDHHRTLYEYEKDCNAKMLAMLESVPDDRRADPRFQRAVTLADHLAAVRENWLTHMAGPARPLAAWWDPAAELAPLRPRFAALEAGWTEYLARLDDAQLAQDFAFTENGDSFRLPTAVQAAQLDGHACYHRGQVALLVDQLGGTTVDTDYVFWAVPESAD